MSEIRIFNAKTGQNELLKPIKPGEISLYVCGATVQSSPHIGHMRVAVVFDTMRRFFENQGYKVKYARNVTDIDDKIIAKSKEAKIHWKDHAKKFENEFNLAYSSLGCIVPTFEPHATEFIDEQIALIKKIEENGHAYQGNPGNCWFDTVSWKDYGELTNQTSENATQTDAEDFRSDKRNPRDFALWKEVKPTDPEDASWDSPWGKGRPGWHIECSAMAESVLGESFDIHGGGLDLRFPHHENEVAQSRAAGFGFAKNWIHCAWVTQKGEKMSKSLGNFLSVAEICGEKPSKNSYFLRLALLCAHHRTMLEWGENTLEIAKKNAEKFVKAANSEQIEKVDPPKKFVDAMSDDFNTPLAFAVIFELLKEGKVNEVVACLEILGLNPLSAQWKGVFEENAEDDFSEDEKNEIEKLLQMRADAKKNKDFAKADEIRDVLAAKGVQIIDTPQGATFKRV